MDGRNTGALTRVSEKGVTEVAGDSVSEVQVNRVVNLTKREIEVLSLVIEGKSSREVAAALFCSKRTIDFHLTRIYDKLQVSNRVQAMRRASLLGLITVGTAAVVEHA